MGFSCVVVCVVVCNPMKNQTFSVNIKKQKGAQSPFS